MEKYDLKVVQGETFRQQLIFKNSDGSLRDLTGCQGFAQVRPDPESKDLICDMQVTVGGEDGTVVLSIPYGVTKMIPAGCYAYDFALRDSDLIVTYYLGGRFTVIPGVTEVSEILP